MPRARIELRADEEIGRISPELYSHFAEHLGECVYGGIWVGPESAIENIGGIRSDVVEAIRKIRPAVIRWPGGCFADDYHWEDGIGPRKSRPRRVNLWWGHDIEDNSFGTHEFIQFCKLVGAQPYIAGNVGSGTARELRDWVEYCNFTGASTLARRRAENGSPSPFNVKFWGVGNEAWGCGGNLSPEDYAAMYRRFATYLHDLGETKLFLIACGPDGNNHSWTRRFFQRICDCDQRFNFRLSGFGAHYYCGTAGTATEYSDAQWYELLARAADVEKLICEQRALMDEFDPQRKISLILDEWGTWHPPTPGRNPKHLWQQNTMRDALVAAITLDTLNRHCDKVFIANVAQMCNVLQAMVLTQEEKMIVTPSYHVFEMYKDHQGGRAIRMESDSPSVAGSASIKAGELTLTLTNRHVSSPAEIEISGLGERRHVTARVLLGESIHSHNTFENPNAVAPREMKIDWPHVILPPASIGSIHAVR